MKCTQPLVALCILHIFPAEGEGGFPGLSSPSSFRLTYPIKIWYVTQREQEFYEGVKDFNGGQLKCRFLEK
jgi:hypothetical protein